MARFKWVHQLLTLHLLPSPLSPDRVDVHDGEDDESRDDREKKEQLDRTSPFIRDHHPIDADGGEYHEHRTYGNRDFFPLVRRHRPDFRWD